MLLRLSLLSRLLLPRLLPQQHYSWACFYYSGAAAAAGQSYAGALLVTPDGEWPPQHTMAAVETAFAECGIEMWELFKCKNPPKAGAPLDLPEEFKALQRPNPLANTAAAAQQ
jgi:hypothetical protein